ncbi:ASCH domain-containing protein [Croceivirga thetidis]|uniref:ASCH domain-containing protein n=1 Tax=Croceivirga thetidis TaxID=2721623 RepID=A0ABX1GPP6_9FLAO|nr:ASCH domain-containing protein [Croceivirga thetidis]NKI31011.1 ASCH domain-containing protein [Croceivirga thetidis]
MKNNSVEKIWERFVETANEYSNQLRPKSGYFGDNEKDANILAELVQKGLKKATSHSLLGLQYREETLPKLDDLFIVTDWAGKAKCIVKTTSVKLVPFFAIHAEHARMEGEGDKSLEYWKKVHWDYYTRELEPFNRLPRESMIVVFERFEKIFE